MKKFRPLGVLIRFSCLALLAVLATHGTFGETAKTPPDTATAFVVPDTPAVAIAPDIKTFDATTAVDPGNAVAAFAKTASATTPTHVLTAENAATRSHHATIITARNGTFTIRT